MKKQGHFTANCTSEQGLLELHTTIIFFKSIVISITVIFQIIQ